MNFIKKYLLKTQGKQFLFYVDRTMEDIKFLKKVLKNQEILNDNLDKHFECVRLLYFSSDESGKYYLDDYTRKELEVYISDVERVYGFFFRNWSKVFWII